tara:strand:- start:1698 stop:1835 length:138 start_codon:yes stop_codon:yes gene_type:complete
MLYPAELQVLKAVFKVDRKPFISFGGSIKTGRLLVGSGKPYPTEY